MSEGDTHDGRSGIGALRRDVMWVVGVGGALGALGRTATASEHDDEDGGGDDADEAPDEEHGDGPVPSTWLHAFETPGVYDLECAPHEGFGMAMRVGGGDETDTDFETSDAESLPKPRAGPVGPARRVLTDPALEPDAIVDEGRVEWSAIGGSGSGDGGGGMPAG